MAKTKTEPTGPRAIDLALQGGGAHGAFTWGVLDYFLEHPDLYKLEGICGTSAGAVNGTLLAYGLMTGGHEGARALLHKFWETVSRKGFGGPFYPAPWDLLTGNGNMDNSPGYLFLQFMTQFSSPQQFNPTNRNDLRDTLLELIDFDRLRSCKSTKLYVCATNVRRGRLRVFNLPEISVEAVLASACLPFLFPAVTIDGEDYWDGGYMGNPPLFPLIDGTDHRDILIVQVNPINIASTPRTSHEIQDRINELSFNSSLMLEMRRIEFVQRLLARGIDLDGKLKEVRIHCVNPEEEIAPLNVSSKLNTEWSYLRRLFDMGRRYATDWHHRHYHQIGVENSVNIRETFM